jgi:hypothetical protein
MFDVLLALLILLPFGIVGFKGHENTQISALISVSMSISSIPIGVLMAHQEILWTPWNSRLLWIFWVGLCLLIGWQKSVAPIQWLQNLRGLGIHSALVVGSVVPVAFPYLVNSSLGRGAPFSNTNNDLAIYVISADNFQNRGFAEFGRVVSYQAGAMVNFEVAGAASWIAWLSHLTGLPIWRSTNIAMLLIVAVTAILLYHLTLLFVSSQIVSMLIALLAVWMPFSRLAQQNYFLSQAISRLCLVLAFYGLVLIWKRKRIGTVAISIATITSLVTYPAGSVSALVVLFAVAFALAVSELVLTRSIKGQLQPVVLFLVSLAVGIVIVQDRWTVIWGNIKWYSKPGVTGWSITTRDFSKWFGIPNASEGIQFRLIAVLMLGVLVASCLYLVVCSVRSRTHGISAVMILAVILFSYLILSVKIGSSTYQSWKFLVTAQPLITVFGLIPVYQVMKHTSQQFIWNTKVIFGIPVLLTIGLLSYNGYQARLMYKDNYQVPTMELEQAAKSIELRQQPNLLIQLNPYLETMIAPVILDVHQAIYATDTYIGPATGNDAVCTLKRKTGSPNEIPVSPNLVISPALACRR